jgi:glycosyltransferase involved in cell wall biosynthesis
MTTTSIKALCITEDLDRPTAELFIGLQRAGIDITVACPRTSPRRKDLVAAGLSVPDIELDDWLAWRGAKALRAEIKRGRYDILHLLSNRALQNGLRASRGLGVRIIAYRGIVGNVSFMNPGSWLRVLHPRIERIICVADAVRDYFLNMKPARWRIPEHKLVRIYKGHDLAWYSAAPANLETVGMPPGAFVLGCTANYRPRKGIEYLVDAVAALPREWNVHLILIGRMDAAGLARHIDKSTARDRIHRLGQRDDAASLSAACDVFVLPSIKREGLARSLVEAMAYGVPPVVTDCGGNPELVAHEVCGLVVPVGDSAALAAAVSRLYQDPELRVNLGIAARKRIRDDFRIADTIAQTLEVYRG